MKFKVEIDTDNSAFADMEGGEIARILRGIAGTVEETSGESFADYAVSLFDVNGNKVGFALAEET